MLPGEASYQQLLREQLLNSSIHKLGFLIS